MTELHILKLKPETWNTVPQIITTLALYDEVINNPSRLSDQYMTSYVIGSLSSDSKMSRDMFASVAILGFNTTVSALLNILEETDGEEMLMPAELAMPPLLADGLNMAYLRSRDNERDYAKFARLLIGGHVGPVDVERLAMARAILMGMAALDVPLEHKANLLAVASFLDWMLYDTGAAMLNANLAVMSEPGHVLAGRLIQLYGEVEEPIWRKAQGWQEEEAV